MSDSLQPHGLQHPRLPCPSLSPRFFSNSCSLNQRCNTTISSSVVPSSSCPQSFPASGSFPMSQFFASSGQSTEVSTSVSPSNEYSGLISLGIDWFDLAVQGAFKSLLQPHSLKTSVLQHSAFFMVNLSHPYMITGKTIALTIQTFVGKVISLLFNMLSRFVIASFRRSKRLLLSWLQSLSTVILEPKKIKCHRFQSFPIYLP